MYGARVVRQCSTCYSRPPVVIYSSMCANAFPSSQPPLTSQRPSTTGMDHVRPRHVCPVQDRVRRQRGERGRDGDLQRMKVKGSRRESMPWQAPPPPHPQPHPLAPEVERCSTKEPHTAAAKRTVDVSTHIGSLRVYMILIKVTCHRRRCLQQHLHKICS